ncbi:MAG: hypothetical protein R2862_04830 [Thermoanaerobaculia bacterium]
MSLAFAMGRLQTEVVSHLPDETTAAERQRLEDGSRPRCRRSAAGKSTRRRCRRCSTS